MDLSAQLKVYPTQRKNAVEQKINSFARTLNTDPLSLPFFDDFSFTPVNDLKNPQSNYPLDSIWTNSRSVWISTGIGVNEPSINVATFDGLNSMGLPYTNVQLSSGMCDTLISRPINLGEPEVAIGERTTVWISFQYQWCGNGEPPDAKDFLRLSFLDTAGLWKTKWEISPAKKSLDKNVFYDTIVQVSGDEFFHNNFQFKFENRGRKTGPFDTWNLDYIFLDKGRTINSNSFPDRALASPLTNLFGDYYAMPLAHVTPTIELDTPVFAIKNNKNAPVENTFGYRAYLNVKNYENGVVTEVNTLLADSATTENLIPGPLDRFTQPLHHLPNLNDPSLYHPNADSIKTMIKIELASGDAADPERGPFLPLDFRINDSSSAFYTLKDYYAYDDGTAEFAAGNYSTGNQFGYAFDMLTADPDTLVGFYAYFPPYSLSINRLININIYEDDNGYPKEPAIYSIPSFTVKTKDINEFQLIKIIEPQVVSGRFYIGYESIYAKIGLDMSNNTGDRIYEKVNGVWTQVDDVYGSLMIRPVFGKGSNGPITGIPEHEPVSLYPNPNQGQFFLKGHAVLLEAYTITGRSIGFTTEDFGDSTQKITLHNPSAGLYILKVQKNNRIVTEKIVVR